MSQNESTEMDVAAENQSDVAMSGASQPAVPNARRWLRFSLRTWLFLLTIICVGVGVRQYVNSRRSLQTEIINTATLIYDGSRRHAKSLQYQSSAMGEWTDGPDPYIGLRDWKWAPWLGRWSKGSVLFCAFDSIQSYSASPPRWLNQVMSSGELKRITFSNLNEKEIDLALIAHCKGLESLQLAGTSYNKEALAEIHKMRHLRELSIHRMQISLRAMLPKGLPSSLVELRLVGNQLQSEGIAALTPCSNLESLEIVSNPVEFHALTHFPKSLKRLRLTETKVNALDLSKLKGCERLEALRLSKTPIDLQQCDEDLLPTSLKELVISEAHLDASSWKMLARLQNLEELTLDECDFEDSDAQGVRLSPHLKVFSATRTHADEHVAAALAAAEGLEVINFAGCQTSDSAAQALGKKPKLRVLLLGDTQLTDGVANWLLTVTTLQRLELYETRVSDHLFEVAPHLKEIDDLRVHSSQVSVAMTNELRKMHAKRWETRQKRAPSLPSN